MFPKVFLLLLLSFNFKFSSQTIIESKCNDKFEPTRYELHKHDGKVLLTAVVQMESTDAFEPILSLELIRFKPYDRKAVFQDKFSFKFREDLYYDEYAFKLQQYSYDKVACLSGFFEDETPSNASINKDTISCKWLINVGAYGVIKSFEGIEPSTYDMITKADTARIVLVSLDTSETVTKDLTDFPIYQWSYARYCEYNKKIYDIDGDMITLKKGNGAFELFVYSLTKYEDKRPRQITLINSKSHSISIFCDDDRNDIIVSTKIGSKESSVLDKYIFRKHIDALRCGISLSIEMGREHSSFSFDDAPLKLIYKTNDFDVNIIQEVKFESDYIAMDEPTIETTPSAPVDEPTIEITSTASVDESTIGITATASVNQNENVDENEKNDKVSPLIGVCLTIITVIKSYFDLW